MPTLPLKHTRHHLRNLLQSVLLIGAMVALFAVCAWMLWGGSAALWAVAGAVVGLVLAPSVSPRAVLAMYDARPLGADEFVQGRRALATLSERAGLARVPRLYYVPSRMLNAFAVGGPDNAAIALTDGMLRALTLRELVGVLAHEVSHIRHRDLWVMNLADIISRLTALLSITGLVMLSILLPLVLLGLVTFPLLMPVVLLFAPVVGSLLQLALSRMREYDADASAVALSGDPHGFASALVKMERIQGGFWEEVILPGRRMPMPSLLRTHPPTGERLRRILPDDDAGPPAADHDLDVPVRFAPVRRPPRRRWTGAWY